MKQVKAILLGAGLRGGKVYAEYALEYPNELKIVAVAEPDPLRRAELAEKHHLPEQMQFTSWEEALEKQIEADCVLVCMQDRMHYAPVHEAMKRGYHVLCEKPMSNDKEEIIRMGEAAKKYGRKLMICHVLRYSPFFTKLKELLDEGKIGKLVSIQHMEGVGYYHQAHSFVRGNWRNSEETSPMILQKCCHDMDILLWLVGSSCKKIQSFGELTYFKEENAPADAPSHCLKGCSHRDDCPFYAPRFYLEHPRSEVDGFIYAVSTDISREKVLEKLENGPYGRCVFRCDNNVVDHQVVQMEFENQVTASLTMCAFTAVCERTITLMGTRGQITGNMEKSIITLSDFVTGTETVIQLHAPEKGHSGSDTKMMHAFVELMNQEDTLDSGRSGAEVSVESHLMSLAAEASRVEHRVIDMKEFSCI